jgi:hypothetical protein
MEYEFTWKDFKNNQYHNKTIKLKWKFTCISFLCDMVYKLYYIHASFPNQETQPSGAMFRQHAFQTD